MTGPGVKARRILGRFPDFMRAADDGKLTRLVVTAAAEPLEELDLAIQQVLESHWVERAGAPDLERIGALCGLERRPDESADGFRQRLMRHVRALLLYGPTPRGVLAVTAATLALELLENERGEPLLLTSRSADPRAPVDPYTHRAVVLSGEAAGQYLDLIENPRETRSFRGKRARSGARWTLHHDGLAPGLPTIVLKVPRPHLPGPEAPDQPERDEPDPDEPAPDELAPEQLGPVAGLRVANLTSGQGVGYRGVLGPGERLVLSPDGGAWLDGRDVSADAYWYRSAHHDAATFDGPSSTFYDEGWEAPVGATHHDLVSLTTAEGRFDHATWGGCTFEPLNLPGAFFDGSAFDEGLFWGPVLAGVKLRWQQRRRAAFRVTLPPALGTDPGRAAAHLEQAARAVQRIRAAGVHATVGFPGWMLGSAVLPGGEHQDTMAAVLPAPFR